MFGVDYENGFERHVPKKYRDKFEDFSDEHGCGDGYWGYLKTGWRCEDTDCHIVHEWTIRDFLKSLRSIVPCDCQECRCRKVLEE